MIAKADFYSTQIEEPSSTGVLLPNVEEYRAKEDRPHIVAILPRGEAIRNFVYTGALDKAGRDAEVSLLSVIPNDELHAMLLARYPSLFQLHKIDESRTVEVLREVLQIAHGLWLWSEAAQERWRLRDLEATTITSQMKRLLKKIACLPFANRTGLELLSMIERKSSRWLRTTDEYVRFFNERKPTLVFNGSHVHSAVAIQAVQAAQWVGIPTATFIFSWDNLTSQGRIMPTYDYYLVWSEGIKKQLLDIYGSVREDQVVVTGTPQFDFHFKSEFYWSREEFCSRVGADPARPFVLYTTGMANHMPGEPFFVESIATMLKKMTDLGSPQLMVRVYPKDRTGRFDYLKQKCPDIIFSELLWEPAWLTPKIEDAHLLTNSLRHAAVGVNVASTISLELCMFDKPVVNIGYNPPGIDKTTLDYARYYQFDHYRPVVESKAISVAANEEELRRLLRQALTDPEAGSTQRKILIQNMFGSTLDGRAAERVAEQLVRLVTKTRTR